MKLQFTLLFLIAYFVLVSCSLNNSADKNDETQKPFVISVATEYAVYRALIEEKYVHDKVQRIVIGSETVSRAFRKQDKSPVLPETLDSFESQNQHSQTIESTKLGLSVPCSLLGKEVLQESFTDDDNQPHTLEDNWDRFYQAYSGAQGIMQLSRVGFDTEGSQALVYVGNMANALGGAGYHVLLVRNKDGAWSIHSLTMAWIS